MEILEWWLFKSWCAEISKQKPGYAAVSAGEGNMSSCNRVDPTSTPFHIIIMYNIMYLHDGKHMCNIEAHGKAWKQATLIYRILQR